AVTNASLSKTIGGNSLSAGSTKQPNPKYSVSSSALSFAAMARRSSDDGVWQLTDQRSLVEKQKELILTPQTYQTIHLNQDALTALLGQAPLEFTNEAASKQMVLTLPMPNGELARFRVEESPIMAPAL